MKICYFNVILKMSIFRWFKTPISHLKKEVIPALYIRTISTGNRNLCELVEAETEVDEEKENPKKPEHPLEKCMEYMDSEAYKITYGDKPVWHIYVRNFKGVFPPKTRRSCWRGGKLNKASPCPICRDEYLLPHYLNVKLLKQFISPFGGQILDSKKTGVCQVQQFKLTVAIKRAQNYGLLTFTVPHRSYDYSVYNKK